MPDHDSTQQDQENELSAYLDGELDPQNVRRVEERLARDPAYRAELQKLERAWDMLDRLPRASVGEDFNKSTIEMVALSASQEAEAITRELPRRRRRQRIAEALVMGAALVVGFVVGTRIWPDPNERLLEDLPVLENLDLYYQVDDVEFLRLLDREGLFEDVDTEHAG
jgi:ferric-dicitrate binding protein FerR (iron transport regulator)